MSTNIFFALMNNGALLLAMVAVYALFTGRTLRPRPVYGKIGTGIVLGLLGIGLIRAAYILQPGIIFDTRSVLLATSGLFFGFTPTLIAMCMTAALRLHQGGAAAWAGTAVIFATGAAGLVWRGMLKRELEQISVRDFLLFGILVHGIMLALMFLMPFPIAVRVVKNIGLPVLLIYPAAQAAVCLLLQRDLHHRRTAAELADNESTYTNLFQNNHVVMLLVDPRDGAIVDANPAACRFYGWSREILRGMNIRQINTLPPEKLATTMKQAAQLETNTFRFQHRRADGTIRDVDVLSGPVKMGGRQLLYSMIRDITEEQQRKEERRRMLAASEETRQMLLSVIEDQKLTEEALRRQDRLLNAAAQASHHLLAESALETAVPAALAALGETSGQDRVYIFERHEDLRTGELLVSQRFEWVQPGIPPQINAPELQNLRLMEHCPRWYDLLSRGLPIEGEIATFPENERKDLEPQGIVSLLAVPIHTDNQFWGFIGLDNCREVYRWSEAERAVLSAVAASFGTAITRHRAEQELRESEARFTELLERMDHIPVQGYDRQHRVIYWNSASEAVYGYSRDEAMGRPIDELILPEEFRKQALGLADAWLAGGPPIPAGECELRDKQGNAVPVYSSHILHVTEAGKQELYCVDIDLRLLKSVEDELHRSATRNRALLNANPDMMFLFATDGTITDYHCSDPEMLYLQPEQFLNRNVQDVLPEEGAQETLRNIQRAQTTGNLQEYTYSLKIQGIPHFFESRMVRCGEHFMAVVRDISERHRLQEALEQRIVALTRPLDEPETLQLETLFDLEEIQRIQDEFSAATGVASIITRTDGTPITRPSNFTRLCYDIIRKTEKGCANCMTSDALLGRHHPDGPVIQPCLSCALWDAGASITVGGKHIANWLIGQVRDETQKEAQVRAYARKIGADENEAAAAFHEVPIMPQAQFKKVAQALFTLARQLSASAYMNMQQARFIAEEKHNTEKLHQLYTAIEQSPETIVITDPQGLIQYVNPAFEKITGYSLKEAVGKSTRILKSGKHGSEFYAALWETLKAGEVWTGRFINQRKDGTLYTEEAVISPVREETGRISGFVAVKRDITAELEREEQFRQVQKMQSIGRLAGGIAHDLNNMLTPILGYAQILLETLAPEDSNRPPIRQIEQAGIRARDLVRQLLAFSRKQDLRMEPLDLHEIMDEFHNLVRRTIREDIHIETVRHVNPLIVLADRGQLEQIIMNLAVNAQDAMPSGGTLTFKTERREIPPEETALYQLQNPGPCAVLSVRDTGTGIPPELLQKIFEPFFTTKPVGAGTGLGLSTVFGIVKQHQGGLRVQSTLGEGTCFEIVLPLTDRPVRSQKEAPILTPVPGPESRKHTIWLVEDEAAVRQLVSQALKQRGFTIRTFNRAAAALECAAVETPPDLLITDVVMPEMHGVELADRFKTLVPNCRTLFISGYSRKTLDASEIPENADFLRKPFTMQHLEEIICRLL